jgi:hypothetical protein
MTRRITFLVPTCEPEPMFKYLLPTVHKLYPIRDLIEFNICFQPPYTDEQINSVLDEFNKYNFKVN